MSSVRCALMSVNSANAVAGYVALALLSGAFKQVDATIRSTASRLPARTIPDPTSARAANWLCYVSASAASWTSVGSPVSKRIFAGSGSSTGSVVRPSTRGRHGQEESWREAAAPCVHVSLGQKRIRVPMAWNGCSSPVMAAGVLPSATRGRSLAHNECECVAGYCWSASAAAIVQGSWCVRCGAQRTSEASRRVNGQSVFGQRRWRMAVKWWTQSTLASRRVIPFVVPGAMSGGPGAAVCWRVSGAGHSRALNGGRRSKPCSRLPVIEAGAVKAPSTWIVSRAAVVGVPPRPRLTGDAGQCCQQRLVVSELCPLAGHEKSRIASEI